MFGLPPDASVWREDFLPPVEERLVQLLERQDAWFRALFEAQMGSRKVNVPGEITIPRPGQDVGLEQPRVETNVETIASWFAGNS